METLVVLLGLLVGYDEPDRISNQQPMQIAKAPRTNVDDLSDLQIVHIYPTPAGWSDSEWARAVRTIDPSTAGRR